MQNIKNSERHFLLRRRKKKRKKITIDEGKEGRFYFGIKYEPFGATARIKKKKIKTLDLCVRRNTAKDEFLCDAINKK
jgi:hypothetical protein